MNQVPYVQTPPPPRPLLELTYFGYHVELFFAWFDFWVGYDAGDPNGDTTVVVETDGKTFRPLKKN